MKKREILEIKTSLYRDAKKIPSFMHYVKYNKNTSMKNELVNMILKKELPGSNYITKGIMPKSLNEIASTKAITIKENNIKDELQWINKLINRYKNELSKYLSYKNEYEKFLVNGMYAEARIILNKIQNEVCLSVWGISQLFLLTELELGIKDHKELLSELSQKNMDKLITFILEFLSFKAEINNSYDSFKYKVNKKFPSKRTSFQTSLLKEYLLFTLDIKYNEKDSGTIGNVLAMQCMMSIIDIYEAYVKAIEILISKEDLEINLKLEILEQMETSDLNDYRLIKCISYISDKDIPIYKDNYEIFSEMLDYYTMGDYENAINTIIKNNLLEEADFSIYDIYVKSCVFSNLTIENHNKNNSIFHRIITSMKCLYTRVDTKRNIQEMINLASMISDLNISKSIINFVMEFDKNKDDTFEYLSEFNSKYFTPKSIKIYNKRTEDLINKFKHNDIYKITIGLFTSEIEHKDIDVLRYKYYKASSLISKNIEMSITLFEELLCNVNEFDKGKKFYYISKVCEKLYYLYIENENYSKALEIVVNTYFIDKDLILNINLEKLYNIIKIKEIDEINNNIKTAIFIYLLNNKDYDELYKALANYTEFKGNFLFSEILDDVDTIEKNKTEYYFIIEKIYILEIIKRFVFVEKDQRINERIKVIRYLIKNNYKQDILQEELNMLVKEQSIKERIKTIDKSKIVVDSKGILQDLDELYKEKFKRFMELKDLNIEIVYVELSKSNGKIDEEIYNILASKKERQEQSFLLFKELVEEYINELLFNTNYGLDKFLSSRIRHGMLQDYLSKPFNNNNILNTKKNSESNEYIINQYVEGKMRNSNDEAKNEIINALSEFSLKIMNKIKTVEDWIRINSEEDTQGLFNYKALQDNIYNLYDRLGRITDYNVFFEELTSIFWEITEENLDVIRKKIDNELCNYFRESLNELDSKLRNLGKIYNMEILNDLQEKVGVCRAILQKDLGLVKSWFQIKKDNQYVDFMFQELISTCIEINDKLNNKYSKISNETNIEIPVLFKGNKFTYWIDIINILYVNAIKHSGFNRIEDTHIKIDANIIDKAEKFQKVKSKLINIENFEKYENSTNDFMMFRIENTLAEELNEEHIYYKIYDIFCNLRESKYTNLVRREGGTGIYKMANILTKNIKGNSLYSFNCENHKFCIEIIIELNDSIIVR